MPGDASLQREDTTKELSGGDASFYRMAVGVCLYLSRDRPDIVFPVKELASRMSKPTIGSLQSLKKLVGYLKSTQDYAVVLEQPLVAVDDGNNPTTSFGFLKASVTVIGQETSAIVDQHQLVCTFCAVPTCLDPAALKESLASLPVRVNSMEWFQRWLMACFFDVVQSLLQGPPLNTTC